MKRTEQVTLNNGEQITITRIKNDVNGNPRYVVHFNDLGLSEYKSTKATRDAGFAIYRGKDYGGGFVFSSYYPQGDLPKMIDKLHS